MFHNKIIQLINEEISNYDFLNNDKFEKERDVLQLINKEEFQKQFIIDSILNRNKIKLDVMDFYLSEDNFSDNEYGKFEVSYSADIEYTYDTNKEPLKFNLQLDGNNVDYSTKSTYDKGDNITPSYGEQWFDYIDWTDVSVKLSTLDENEIDFVAYKKSPENIRKIFVKSYLEGVIEKDSELEINDGVKE
jgi:hypothetical protein